MAGCKTGLSFTTENRRTAHFAFIEPYVDGGAEAVDRQVVTGDICNHAYGPGSRTGIIAMSYVLYEFVPS